MQVKTPGAKPQKKCHPSQKRFMWHQWPRYGSCYGPISLIGEQITGRPKKGGIDTGKWMNNKIILKSSCLEFPFWWGLLWRSGVSFQHGRHGHFLHPYSPYTDSWPSCHPSKCIAWKGDYVIIFAVDIKFNTYETKKFWFTGFHFFFLPWIYRLTHGHSSLNIAQSFINKMYLFEKDK